MRSLGGVMIGMGCGQLRAEDVSAVRRYQRAMAGLLLVYMGLQSTLLRHGLHGLPAEVAAGLQGAALFGMIVAVGMIAWRRSRGTATAALNLQALLWGSLLTMFVVTVWGFVEVFGR